MNFNKGGPPIPFHQMQGFPQQQQGSWRQPPPLPMPYGQQGPNAWVQNQMKPTAGYNPNMCQQNKIGMAGGMLKPPTNQAGNFNSSMMMNPLKSNSNMNQKYIKHLGT